MSQLTRARSLFTPLKHNGYLVLRSGRDLNRTPAPT